MQPLIVYFLWGRFGGCSSASKYEISFDIDQIGGLIISALIHKQTCFYSVEDEIVRSVLLQHTYTNYYLISRQTPCSTRPICACMVELCYKALLG
jgi:hypothetical protein